MKHLDAEQAVIGAILRDNTVLYRLGDLSAEHFFLDDHKIIFSEISALVRSGKTADTITVSDRLKRKGFDCGGFEYLAQIELNTPSVAGARSYAETIVDDALRRSLRDLTARLADEIGRDDHTTSAELLEKLQSSVMGIAVRQTAREPVVASAAMAKHIDVIEARSEGKTAVMSTGFEKLDYMLNGGLKRSDMIVIGARPSMGKTALSLNIAANVAKHRKVLFLSQEMGTGQILDRLTASLGKVELSAILKGEMTQQQWNGYTTACAAIESIKLFIDEQGGLTINDVRIKARKIKQQYGLDLLVLDYLQLMNGEGTNRNAQIEEISRGIKNLAKELDITVIVLSQLNREADKRPGRRPAMSDLRDSGSIEQDADVVIFIYRDEVVNPESHLKGFADLIIAKNRQGRIGDVLLTYCGEYTLFESTTQPRPKEPHNTKRKGLAEHL